jgi:2'-hydroxyisoflavone reductase
MAEMVYGCKAVTSAAVRFTWVLGSVVAEAGVNPMGLIPWIDPGGPLRGASHFRRDAAFKAGLTFRPFAETARDTLTWFKTLPAERQARLVAGLPPDKEKEILAAWRARPR